MIVLDESEYTHKEDKLGLEDVLYLVVISGLSAGEVVLIRE